MINPVTQATPQSSPAFSGQSLHQGKLGSLTVTQLETVAYAEHLGRRSELAHPFKGNHFNAWAATQPDAGVGPDINLLTRFFEDGSLRRIALAQPAVVANPALPAAIGQGGPSEPPSASLLSPRNGTSVARQYAHPAATLAQNRTVSLPMLSAAPPACDKRVDMSLADLRHIDASNPLEISELLTALSARRATLNDSLPALLSGLSRFIKDVEERMSPERPGVHTVTKQLGLCLGHLEQAQARRLLSKLEGKLGDSARAVIQFAAYKARSTPASATAPLVRLSQCEHLFKGLVQGLGSHLHDTAVQSGGRTPMATNFNELTLLERTAFSEAMSV